LTESLGLRPDPKEREIISTLRQALRRKGQQPSPQDIERALGAGTGGLYDLSGAPAPAGPLNGGMLVRPGLRDREGRGVDGAAGTHSSSRGVRPYPDGTAPPRRDRRSDRHDRARPDEVYTSIYVDDVKVGYMVTRTVTRRSPFGN
jgi:hypothetical protein